MVDDINACMHFSDTNHCAIMILEPTHCIITQNYMILSVFSHSALHAAILRHHEDNTSTQNFLVTLDDENVL